jgi:iron(III) transport system substrate-binding protein
LAFAFLLACPAQPPPLPAVRVHATVSGLAAQALISAARLRGVAQVTLVSGGPAEAEVAWFGDPTQALEAGHLLAPGVVPPQPDVSVRWKDLRGRFAPVCATARVLVRSPAAELRLAPERYRDLADPRLAGRQAVASPASGLGPVWAAALATAWGEEGALRFLSDLAANRPRIAAGDGEARALVAAGVAAAGLTGSEEAAAGAVSAAALEVVWPDQSGRGSVILPTAASLTRSGASSEAAQRLLAWMAGPEAERLLVARAPGLMPLRTDVPVPPGVRPADAVRSLHLDWDALAAERRRLMPRLGRWPEP